MKIKNPGIWLGILVLFIKLILSLVPSVAESVYGHFCFPAIRFVQDTLFSKIPFAVGYLFLSAVTIIFIIGLFRLFSRRLSFKRWLLRLLNGAGWLLFSFYLLWGFNYCRPNLESRIHEPKEELNEGNLKTVLNYLEMQAPILRKLTVKDTSSILSATLYPEIEDSVLNKVKGICSALGYDGNVKMPVRFLKPRGYLRKMGIAGIYDPFTGEPNVDASYTALPRIYTEAHEMAHACGVTDEGAANYIAWLACIRTNSALSMYAAEYILWWRTLSATAPEHPDSTWWSYRPKEMLRDHRDLMTDAQRYTTWFWDVSEKVNNEYLKFQGISKGTKSYDAFTKLAWIDMLNRIKKENQLSPFK